MPRKPRPAHDDGDLVPLLHASIAWLEANQAASEEEEADEATGVHAARLRAVEAAKKRHPSSKPNLRIVK